jgi:hypothetical protein
LATITKIDETGTIVSLTNAELIEAWQTANFALAKGSASHSEGLNTLALGDFSHAEGCYTNAIGKYSHAEGYGTTAFGISSHASGEGT